MTCWPLGRDMRGVTLSRERAAAAENVQETAWQGQTWPADEDCLQRQAACCEATKRPRNPDRWPQRCWSLGVVGMRCAAARLQVCDGRVSASGQKRHQDHAVAAQPPVILG